MKANNGKLQQLLSDKKTLEQVPAMLREQVAEMLADLEVTD